jgi:hypothetical protein
MTLKEYQAQKKKPQMKKDIRGHDHTKFDLKTNDYSSESVERDTAAETLTSTIKDQELYNIGLPITKNADLLGF